MAQTKFARTPASATRPPCGAASGPTTRAGRFDRCALEPGGGMPWTADRHPVSMCNMTPLVRDKAIEIANALLRERVSEGSAIA
ncbi:hypothetical protein [Burkholderia sp. ABCPW 14]|uniref:hypothetical protein n=1 Tax=Burkholderia sp. ABCPW 14 TaxID=1637860 RepID=UPI0012E33972|nr:hypothetical protein [Burkholderia sp. ABCPW 14]